MPSDYRGGPNTWQSVNSGALKLGFVGSTLPAVQVISNCFLFHFSGGPYLLIPNTRDFRISNSRFKLL